MPTLPWRQLAASACSIAPWPSIGCVKALRTRQWLPADCQLTKREVECLRWASIGKTDKEISMILGRSHATVRFHIQNAGEKLDAVNRSQTIFKAAQLGYLGYAA